MMKFSIITFYDIVYQFFLTIFFLNIYDYAIADKFHCYGCLLNREMPHYFCAKCYPLSRKRNISLEVPQSQDVSVMLQSRAKIILHIDAKIISMRAESALI